MEVDKENEHTDYQRNEEYVEFLADQLEEQDGYIDQQEERLKEQQEVIERLRK